MKAWHFLPENKKLRYADNRIVVPNETYRCPNDRPIELCRNGMHGSVNIMDALSYAPGPIVCRVNITGGLKIGDDKIAGRERNVLWMYDATPVLRKFACLCALDVVHLWDAPGVVIKYLKTQDPTFRAAAKYAARAAAKYAARYAAEDAEREKQSKRLYQMIMRGRKSK